jgi:8-oxo-dGTP pyrophosphatase MutT (NUDIX family)
MLPGGHIEDNELPHEAVIREVKEETGLKISLLQKPNKKYRTKIVTPMPMPYDLRVMPCNDGKKRDVDFVYTAKILAGKLKINNESTEAKWLSRKEIKTDSRIGPWTKLHALKLI